ncbi:lanthionine synthetase C family protein [Streptosporangium sp. NPDC000396]|uniref:lanthionine synthetase C family protein n=1 Tax=Streptosporangium sp. NPDC000396 TaxID=3366185 RepID=UPI0036CE0CBC
MLTVEDVVGQVAARLADPAGVRRGDPLSTDGSAGVALFYAELARHEASWLGAAHAHLALAAGSLTRARSAGLHHGPAAVLAATQSCGALGGHYPGLRLRLVRWLADDQRRRLEAENTGREPGTSWTAYDLISGLTGTGRLLLAAVIEGGREERETALPALRATLGYLVGLAGTVRVDGHDVPGWWVPPERQPTEFDRGTFPRGDFNLGLAHGIPGPLALLALCAGHGIRVEGHDAAMHRIGTWIAGWAMHGEDGPYWQLRIPFDDEVAGTAPRQDTIAAWCYGTPGVAFSLLRASEVLAIPEWRRLALDGLHAVQPGPYGPTVCHGHSGLLQVFVRAGQAAADQRLLDRAAELGRQVMDAADPEAPFMFRHLQPEADDTGWISESRLEEVDTAGIVEGAAGVAAALLSLLPGGDPYWDRVLMLS